MQRNRKSVCSPLEAWEVEGASGLNSSSVASQTKRLDPTYLTLSTTYTTNPRSFTASYSTTPLINRICFLCHRLEKWLADEYRKSSRTSRKRSRTYSTVSLLSSLVTTLRTGKGRLRDHKGPRTKEERLSSTYRSHRITPISHRR
jgi:hypothetical protein